VHSTTQSEPVLKQISTQAVKNKNFLYITLGDPSGVSPEVLVKCLLKWEEESPSIKQHTVLLGEKWVLEQTAKQLQVEDQLTFCESNVPLHNAWSIQSFELLAPSDFRIGNISPACGHAAYTYFTHAIDRCLASVENVSLQEGKPVGIVTAPIHKEAMNLAGHAFMGHTDILEQRTKKHTVMTIVHPKVFVAHVTDHLPLRKALDAITPERVIEVTETLWHSLEKILPNSPRIALAGINPHAGENGVLGQEEIEILKPTIKKLQEMGISVEGPIPADTVFYSAINHNRYDGVVAMYHDQGFGPMKTLDLAHGVNCTLGIPFVRTSPDHGTAFDIAGAGTVDETSMWEAWKLAKKLAF
jgi:4-hydroxythreonine-4-phosphate dehydrogenase